MKKLQFGIAPLFALFLTLGINLCATKAHAIDIEPPLKYAESWTAETWLTYFDQSYPKSAFHRDRLVKTGEDFLQSLNQFVGELFGDAQRIPGVREIFITHSRAWVLARLQKSDHVFTYADAQLLSRLPVIHSSTLGPLFEAIVPKAATPTDFLLLASNVIVATWAQAPSTPYSRIEETIQRLLLPIAHKLGVIAPTADDLFELVFDTAVITPHYPYLTGLGAAYLKLVESKPTRARIQKITSTDRYIVDSLMNQIVTAFETMLTRHSELADYAWKSLFSVKPAGGPRSQAQWAADFHSAVSLRGTELRDRLTEIIDSARAEGAGNTPSFRTQGAGGVLVFQKALVQVVRDEVLAQTTPLEAKDWSHWLTRIAMDTDARTLFRAALQKTDDPTELLRLSMITLTEGFWRFYLPRGGSIFLGHDHKDPRYWPELELDLLAIQKTYNRIHHENLSMDRIIRQLVTASFDPRIVQKEDESRFQESLLDYLESAPSFESLATLEWIIQLDPSTQSPASSIFIELVNFAIPRMKQHLSLMLRDGTECDAALTPKGK